MEPRTQDQRLIYLIEELIKENEDLGPIKIPMQVSDQKSLLRGLMNIRPPRPIGDEFLQVQDAYLQEELRSKKISHIEDLNPIQDGLYLWQGDITTLGVQAIVNAANSQMTGCYSPNHGCIDNAIHTYAGIQPRLKCQEIMEAQGHLEPTGSAKITPAYNLPSDYVIHTVGPIIRDKPSAEDRDLLASSYRSCLELAAAYNLESIGFCCISTGVFNYPNDRAASIAISTVKEFMKKESSIRKVVFNVFKDQDLQIYQRLLRED